MRAHLLVVTFAAALVAGGCKNDREGSVQPTEKAKPVPTCEEVCEHLVGCQASEHGVASNTVMAHEARQMCEHGCPGRWSSDERRCWIDTACSDIPENPMDSEKCPKYAKKVEAERKAEEEADRKACEPKIEMLKNMVGDGKVIELTESVLEGLRCVTTTLDVPDPYPSLEKLFPALKEKLATARDDFERDEFRTKFQKTNASAITSKREEWEKRREEILTPLWAAIGTTYWLEVPVKLSCNYGGCDVSVDRKDMPDALYRFPFRIGGTYEKKDDDYPAHPFMYEPEHYGLPPQQFGVASSAIAKKARDVDLLRIQFGEASSKKEGKVWPFAYFEPKQYRFCVSETKECSGWIDSTRLPMAPDSNEIGADFKKAMSGEWKAVE